jgi:enoyl-CoA hydratase/carnithine racemase
MAEFSSEYLTLEQRDGVAVLGLNRPEKRNAVDAGFIDDIHRFFYDPPEGTRAVLLHGQGDHFCAGLDISELKVQGVEAAQAMSRKWHRTFELIQLGGIPVIAALKGFVFGGGLELAASTHVRVAEPSAVYQLPEVGLGIFPGGGASVRVSRIVGSGRCVEMMLTARRVAADEGQTLGLSHYLVGDGEGFDKALELATGIARNPVFANATIVNAVNRIGDMSGSDGLYVESLASALTAVSEEAQERISGFLNRRE